MSDTIALVGSETLLGREMRDLLAASSLGADVRLIAGVVEASGVLASQGEEATVVARLEALSLADADVVILAGDAESSRSALDLTQGQNIIDLTHTAEERSLSRLRAPMVEPSDFSVAPNAIHSIAHPASIALALVLGRIEGEYPVSNAVAHVFEPASERGVAGIEELQGQTVSLLSFKPMPKKVFDTQLSFNLLAQFGEEAPVRLEDIETRIERHLVTLLQNAGRSLAPSLRLVQAPVFHGYSISLWVEFAERIPAPSELGALLESDEISVHAGDLEPPNNVGMAGQDGVAIGAITRDRHNPRAIWLWCVADNLRLAAQNAMMVAQELV